MNRVKPLTLKELELKEEMKARCLNKGQYIDEKAKDKFYMLCHLEDFEVQYYDLLQENTQLKEKYLNAVADYETTKSENQQLHNKMDDLEKYSRGNIEACENRLNSPFCNFERVTKDLMIHKNYLEMLKESE